MLGSSEERWRKLNAETRRARSEEKKSRKKSGKKEQRKRKKKERERHGSKGPPLQGTGRFRELALQKLEQLGGEGLLFGYEEVGGDFAEVPDEAEPGEGFEGVVSDVDFPPEEALAGAGHVMVMIVVPAFAEGHESEEPVVAAGVRGLVTARTEKMRERIDGEGVMPEERGAEAEAPEDERKAADEKKRGNENGWGNEIVFVEPAKFGKFGEVADVVDPRADVLVGHNPAEMRPEKTEERGGMEIVFLIGEAMMMAMVSGPPENAFLRGGHGHEGDDELKGAAGFIRAVRKIAVIAGGDEKHANDEKRDASDEIRPVKRKEENAERKKMNDGEGNRGKNRDGGTVGKSYSPIAHSGRHPASSLREIKCNAKPSRSGANAEPFSV